uniref:Uncharacterized protein n=1 Tax=Strix occidentalis caurina TaxID=311401 RepID=A0A8D0ESY6_STROC
GKAAWQLQDWRTAAPLPAGKGRADLNCLLDRSKANALPMKSKKASSFHEFARNTSDAWDIGDDEDEDFSSSSSSLQTLNSKVAKAMAARVLENHSKLWAKPEWAQSALSDVTTNCKVIKSSSEAQLSRTAEETCVEKTCPEKFRQLLFSHSTDLDELRKCSWPGVPREVRPVMWRLLSVSTRTAAWSQTPAGAKPPQLWRSNVGLEKTEIRTKGEVC